MLKKIKLKKLFGRFDYNIKLNDNGITIITGPNGYGKSTILTILDEFCNKGLIPILRHSFDSIIFFTDKDELTIKKLKEHYKIDDITFSYPNNSKYSRYLNMHPYLKKINDDEFINLKTNEHIIIDNFKINLNDYKIYNEYELLDFPNFDDKFLSKSKSDAQSSKKKIIQKIDLIRTEIGHVSFIKEQRLIDRKIIQDERRPYSTAKFEYISTISDNSEKLKKEIEKVMGLHSALANELDSSYIIRLFETKTSIDEKNFDDNLKELQEKQKKLNHYGLAEIKNFSKLLYMKKFAIDLYVYFEDTKKKYNVFESLISKLELYESIVNKKLSFKQMKLSRENGISIVTNEGDNLELTSLSSGEQEILVLYYKLIFESNVNVLLIDEPEISLHVAWQKEILDDLKKIVELNKNIQVIVSTHSPQIISGNFDIQIDLGEQYNG